MVKFSKADNWTFLTTLAATTSIILLIFLFIPNNNQSNVLQPKSETFNFKQTDKNNQNPKTLSVGKQEGQNTQMIVPEQEFELPRNLPAGIKASNLSQVGGVLGKAMAVSIIDGKDLLLAIEASLSNPPSGYHYAAWLTNNQKKSYYNLGKFQKVGNNFLLSAKLSQDFFTNYPEIIVTQEKIEDNSPEKRLLQGSF